MSSYESKTLSIPFENVDYLSMPDNGYPPVVILKSGRPIEFNDRAEFYNCFKHQYDMWKMRRSR